MRNIPAIWRILEKRPLTGRPWLRQGQIIPIEHPPGAKPHLMSHSLTVLSCEAVATWWGEQGLQRTQLIQPALDAQAWGGGQMDRYQEEAGPRP